MSIFFSKHNKFVTLRIFKTHFFSNMHALLQNLRLTIPTEKLCFTQFSARIY